MIPKRFFPNMINSSHRLNGPQTDLKNSGIDPQQKTQNAEEPNQQEANNAGPDQMPPPSPPPVVLQFMAKLGVSPTGSKDGDMAAMLNKISIMETQAKTPGEKASAKGLRSELASVIASAESMGQQQMADMNKHFMLK